MIIEKFPCQKQNNEKETEVTEHDFDWLFSINYEN